MPNSLKPNQSFTNPFAITEHRWGKYNVPLVSISCITFNHGNFIRDAIEGFLKQATTFPVEILIHDDASTDETASIIKKYENKYPDLIFPIYQTKNQYSEGKIGLFTHLLPRARGKYIALCEGDDYWTDPLKLQRQVDFLETNPEYSGTYHDTLVIHENQSTSSHLFRKNLEEIISAEDTISKIAPFHTSSFVFRRDTVLFPSWIQKVKSGDMAIFSIVAANGPLRKVGGVCSVYRKHDGGISNSRSHTESFHQDRIELIRLLNQFHHYEYDLKALRVIEQHRNKIPNSGKAKSTYDIELSIDNLDRYYRHTSIKNAIDWAMPALRGLLLDFPCVKMPYKEHILRNSSVSECIRLNVETALEEDRGNELHSIWDGKAIPFGDKSFDSSVAIDALEYCSHPEMFLFEVNRILKPGGVFFFTVPYNKYRYTPVSLEGYLRNSNFVEMAIRATGGWYASIALMLGSWVRRVPMLKEKRKLSSKLFKPVIEFLIKKDKISRTVNLEGQMIVRLYGLAKKQ